MEIYSIIDNTPRPALLFNNFTPDILPLISGPVASKIVLLRATHLNNEVYAALFGVPCADNSFELYLFAQEGKSAETSSNAVHHHVTALTKDAKAYATKLGTTKFFIRTITRKPEFFTERLPEWESHINNRNVTYATLEVL
tara:strand:+ start:2337 stop:2759 length:423 start_codon:yes stop_codon:yes gene_type:complete